MQRLYDRRAGAAGEMTAPGTAMESRLAELEAKLSFCEDLLEELNRTVYRQQQQIDLLQKELVTLREQVKTSMPAELREPADETPPHY